MPGAAAPVGAAAMLAWPAARGRSRAYRGSCARRSSSEISSSGCINLLVALMVVVRGAGLLETGAGGLATVPPLGALGGAEEAEEEEEEEEGAAWV